MEKKDYFQERLFSAEEDTDAQAIIIKKANIDYEPKLSVIIPVYNTEKYLRECLDSVVNQTLKEIEIICVDDGSTDASLEILKKYAEKDNRFTIIAQQNMRAGIARNVGLSEAQGEYIAFMDSDDLYPQNYTLEMLYNCASENNVKICGGSMRQLKDDIFSDDNVDFTFNGFSFNEDKLMKFRDYQSIYGFWRFIYKLNFLKSNNLRFPDLKRFEDPVFLLLAMNTAKEFYALKEPTYVYRIQRKHHSYDRETANDLLLALKFVVDYSYENNLDVLYSSIYNRVCSGGANLELANETLSQDGYLKYIGHKKLSDKETLNILEYFKGNVLISSLAGREYVSCLKSENGKIEEFLKRTRKPELVLLHGVGDWYPQKETLNYAIDNALPLVYEEDGFIRSADTWCNNTVDKKYTNGISFTFTNDVFHFDATKSSFLERLINNPEIKFTENQIRRARKNINLIIKNNLTKYNHQPIFEPKIGREGVPKVLVVDQSYGDASIELGLASDETFKDMLDSAIKENPDSDIIIKTHPDAIAPGTSRPMGYYSTIESSDNVYILRDAINPISLIKYVDKVYVCTTQLGFEALMCGKEVHTFGMPFYAGWGLTIDKLKCARRTEKRTLEELFYIAYIMYSYYVNPVSGKICSIEQAIKYLLKLRKEYRSPRKVLNKKKIIKNIFSVTNEPIRKLHKVITVFGVKIKIKRKQKGKLSFLEKIFSVRNRESCGNRWYKVINFLGINISIKNDKLTYKRKLEAANAQLCKLRKNEYSLRYTIDTCNKIVFTNFINKEIKDKTILMVEINICHGECLVGMANYFLDLGYNVDVLISVSENLLNPFSRLKRENLTITVVSPDMAKLILHSEFVKNYEYVYMNSDILYSAGRKQSLDFFNLIPIEKHRIIQLGHEMEKLDYEKYKGANLIALADLPIISDKDFKVVNTHFFGKIDKYRQKNKKTNFVIVGNIQNCRKNYNLLLDAVKELVEHDITNFQITIIARMGNLNSIPQNIKHYIDFKGSLSYGDMYKEIERADFFLPLLDPENPEHDRYIMRGTSGSFQLIYGFAIPPVINRKFTKLHFFDENNSLIYKKNSELAKTMAAAINMGLDKYASIKANLAETADKIYQDSIENLKEMLKI